MIAVAWHVYLRLLVLSTVIAVKVYVAGLLVTAAGLVWLCRGNPRPVLAPLRRAGWWKV